MTVTDPVPDVVASAVSRLADEQWRVAGLVDAALTRGLWEVSLRPEQRQRLVRLGHFSVYAAELDWTPRDVAGHLRDSARIFADRIRRMRAEAEPVLVDFVTDAPERLAEYRVTPAQHLAGELRLAQAEPRRRPGECTHCRTSTEPETLRCRPAPSNVEVRRAGPAGARTVLGMVREIAAQEGDRNDFVSDLAMWTTMPARPDVVVLVTERDGVAATYGR